jgi:uncharacterized protein (DUF4415 family)
MATARRPKVDPDNPELGAEFFSRAKRGLAHLPAPMQRAIEHAQRGRGPQKTPTKQQVTLRLSRDVVETYRSTGKGWQARIDADRATSARRIRNKPTKATVRSAR